MYSIRNSANERVNDVIIAVNAIIQNGVDAGTMNDTDANVLHEAIILLRTNTKLLNSTITFNEFILSFNANSRASAFMTSNDNTSNTNAVNPNI